MSLIGKCRCPSCRAQQAAIELKLGPAEQRKLVEATVKEPCFRMWMTTRGVRRPRNQGLDCLRHRQRPRRRLAQALGRRQASGQQRPGGAGAWHQSAEPGASRCLERKPPVDRNLTDASTAGQGCAVMWRRTMMARIASLTSSAWAKASPTAATRPTATSRGARFHGHADTVALASAVAFILILAWWH
jgi:hypothetical protein